MNFSVFDLLFDEFSTSSIIFETVLSLSVFVTSTSMTELVTIVPDKMVSPVNMNFSADSPVNADKLTYVCPSIILPSRGTLSPTFTRIMSPTLTLSRVTSISVLSNTRFA